MVLMALEQVLGGRFLDRWVLERVRPLVPINENVNQITAEHLVRHLLFFCLRRHLCLLSSVIIGACLFVFAFVSGTTVDFRTGCIWSSDCCGLIPCVLRITSV